MRWPIRLRSAAETDVAGCARYLQDRNIEAAIRFLDAFDATLTLLANSPGIGSLCQFDKPALKGVRVWPISGFRSYLVFYRLLADEIEVIRVLHGARDLNAVFGEGET